MKFKLRNGLRLFSRRKFEEVPWERPSRDHDPNRVFQLNMRRGNHIEEAIWSAHETAVIICDMWNNHWCKRAAQRCSELAPHVNRFAQAARTNGALVIHAPSDTMSFYSGMPPRERARRTRAVTPPLPITMRELDPAREAALPVDDSDGGCDDEPPSFLSFPLPWTSQDPAIVIAAEDIVSDDGEEIYSILASCGIRNIFMTGVHTNKCILARPFGIRQMVLLGMNVGLVRDLTDSLYNPAMSPWVSHDRGTELMVEHIEKYWCPSFDGKDLLIPRATHEAKASGGKRL